MKRINATPDEIVEAIEKQIIGDEPIGSTVALMKQLTPEIRTALSTLEVEDTITDQYLKDEREQAVKRGGESYANGYVEGLKDGVKLNSTLPTTDEREVLMEFANWIYNDSRSYCHFPAPLIDRYLAEKQSKNETK